MQERILIELSSLIIKLIVLFMFQLYINHISQKNPVSSFNVLKLVGLVFMAQGICFSLANIFFTLHIPSRSSLPLYALMEIAAIMLLLFWIKCFLKKDVGIIIFIINGILILPFLYYQITGGLFSNQFALKWLLWILVMGNWIYLSIQIYKVSEFNSENPSVVIVSRSLLVIMSMFITVITYIFYPREGLQENNNIMRFVIHSVLVPLSYLFFFRIVRNYDQLQDNRIKKELGFVHNDVESLFEFMRVLGSAMADKLSMDEILKYIITSTVNSTKADAGAILMIDDYEDILKVKAVSGFFPPLYSVPNSVKSRLVTLEAYFQSTPIRVGETILGEAVKSGEAIYIKNSFNDSRMKANTLNDTLFVSSVIIMPLVISKRVLGVLAIINREREKFFTDSDFSHLKTFAEYASLNIDFVLTYMELLEKKEMEREISIAADIQQKLLPKKLPKLKSAELEAYSIPAKGVSGDYYDVLQLKGDKLALVMCDVAGKGVPAAMVMVMIRSILHLIASGDREVSTILTWVNRGISGQIDIDHYATMSILFYNQSSGELTYTNAAHHPLLIYRAKTGTTETVDTDGLPVGIEKTTKYGQKKVKLHPGDVIVMYTDGLIEAMNVKGEMYTTERFVDLVAASATLAPKEIIKAIKADISAFVGNAKQHDDQTLLLMKVQ